MAEGKSDEPGPGPAQLTGGGHADGAVVKLHGARKTTVLRLDRHRVQPDPALFDDLKLLLGRSCLAG